MVALVGRQLCDIYNKCNKYGHNEHTTLIGSTKGVTYLPGVCHDVLSERRYGKVEIN